VQDLFFFLRRFGVNLSHRLDFLPPLLARVVIGFVFVKSGWGKLHNLDQVIAYFTSLGIPAPEIQAPFVAGTELVCGLLVLVGLATRLAALPLIGTMVVAIATALWPDIEGVNGLFGTSEFLYVVLLVGLVIRGSGWLGLDALVARRIDAADPSAPRHAPVHAGVGQRA
jgi:putative oxidoreductase